MKSCVFEQYLNLTTIKDEPLVGQNTIVASLRLFVGENEVEGATVIRDNEYSAYTIWYKSKYDIAYLDGMTAKELYEAIADTVNNIDGTTTVYPSYEDYCKNFVEE